MTIRCLFWFVCFIVVQCEFDIVFLIAVTLSFVFSAVNYYFNTFSLLWNITLVLLWYIISNIVVCFLAVISFWYCDITFNAAVCFLTVISVQYCFLLWYLFNIVSIIVRFYFDLLVMYIPSNVVFSTSVMHTSLIWFPLLWDITLILLCYITSNVVFTLL